MKNEIDISIIIPVYNRQDLVKETLDSVLSQTYQNWECIVVDDGSSDNTWLVLEEYSKIDNRIKIHRRNREPKGAPTCRNIGAELSEGEYLIFWDSDDLLAPWCLEERVTFMNEKQNLDFGLFQLLHVSNNYEGSLRCFIGEDDYLKRFIF
jgi:glycosyltransferase involved in cell wall biosynthesis